MHFSSLPCVLHAPTISSHGKVYKLWSPPSSRHVHLGVNMFFSSLPNLWVIKTRQKIQGQKDQANCRQADSCTQCAHNSFTPGLRVKTPVFLCCSRLDECDTTLESVERRQGNLHNLQNVTNSKKIFLPATLLLNYRPHPQTILPGGSPPWCPTYARITNCTQGRK